MNNVKAVYLMFGIIRQLFLEPQNEPFWLKNLQFFGCCCLIFALKIATQYSIFATKTTH